jgi:hypothetical protein
MDECEIENVILEAVEAVLEMRAWAEKRLSCCEVWPGALFVSGNRRRGEGRTVGRGEKVIVKEEVGEF